MIAEPRPAPPTTLVIAPENFPKELTDRAQWMCGAWEWDEGDQRYVKVPISPRTGRKADYTKARNWAPFPLALAYYDAHRDELAGMAFILSPDDPFFLVDQDKVIDPETGELSPDAQTIVAALRTYTDLSTRGSGVHSIGRGTKSGSRCRKNGCPIEVYDHDRVVWMTGHIRGFAEITDCQAGLDALYAGMFPQTEQPKTVDNVITFPLNLADDELLKRCEGNAKFRRLAQGDDSDYPDDSEDGVNKSSADLGFANIIVKNGGTAEQIDTLMRRFRYRRKWDRDDYRQWTIDTALDGTVTVWQPPAILTITAANGGSDQLGDTPPDDLNINVLWRELLTLRSEVTELRRIGEIRDRRYEAERAKQRTDAKIERNTGLGTERYTGVAIADLLEARFPKDADIRTVVVPIPRLTIARRTGFGENTAGTHAKVLESLGAIRVTTVEVEDVDPETGEITGTHPVTAIGLGDGIESVDELRTFLATVKSPTKANQGGNRRCRKHPDAALVTERMTRTTVEEITRWRCAECAEVVHEATRTITVADVQDRSDQDGDTPSHEDSAGINSRGRTVIRSDSVTPPKTPSRRGIPT